ncbi:MAG: tRNA (adenosine(37)-N6)-threonylcarbamoyltransferase complex dimerization subunit type 1 TsaB [Candidatus Levybacteria bacterium]|nr:tRNA (adenosine(37)-N6)-threonylcarbamoyltransferase complex dimerization subunit type 1 TsaB [Candidatus Levybacteria bacterium]
MNKLIIDTTDSKKTTIKLQSDKFTDELTEENIPKSQTVLLLIDKVLKRNELSPTEIDEIKVSTGPGSFTGTRVGVAVANALGFGLNIKVNGSKSKQATPKYS